MILALDPGGQTGFALLNVVDRVSTLVAWGQYEGSDLRTLRQLVKLSSVVVFEKFMDMGGPTDKQSMEIIGYIRMCCLYEGKPCFGYLPVARHFITKRLPALEKNHKPKGDHKTTHRWDALLHGATHAWSKLNTRSFIINGDTVA